MGFLGNSDIILTISVLFLGTGLASIASAGRVRLLTASIFLANLLLFLVLHRYGSRLGSGSPALQLIFAAMLLAPVGLQALARERSGARDTLILFVLAGLMAVTWIVFLFSPWTAALRTAAHPAFFMTFAYALSATIAASMTRAASVTALLLFYAFLFSFGTGTLQETPEPAGVRVWNALLWSLPVPVFLLLSRGKAALLARAAFCISLLPCPLLILWPGLPAGNAPGLEFHAWWVFLLAFCGGAAALEMHLKNGART